MFDELIKTIKTVLFAVILLSMFKIYENGGYSNPITIAVLVIMFSLWFLFRIELNEDVQEKKEETPHSKETYSPPSSPTTIPSKSSSPPKLNNTLEKDLKRRAIYRNMQLGLQAQEKEDKRMTKYQALVKSKSPIRKNN